MHNCPICELPFGSHAVVEVKTKGQKSLKKYSILFGDGKFSSLDLQNDKFVVTVHEICRKVYTKPSKDHYPSSEKLEQMLRNPSMNDLSPDCENQDFDYRKLCLLCGKDASDLTRWRDTFKAVEERMQIKYMSYSGPEKQMKHLLHLASLWGEEVLERIEDKDLLSLRARYHVECAKRYTAPYRPEKRKPHKSAAAITSYLEKLRKDLKQEFIDEEDGNRDTNIEETDDFDYEKKCVICAKDVSENLAKGELLCVKTSKTGQILMKMLALRPAYYFEKQLKKRIENKDLVLLNARLHKSCYVNLYKPSEQWARPEETDNRSLNKTSTITDPKDIDENGDLVKFDYSTLCVICGLDTSEDSEGKVRVIQRQDTGKNLLNASFVYMDKWHREVRHRVENKDLISLGARYHNTCYPQFLTSAPATDKHVLCIGDGDTSFYLQSKQELEEAILNELFEDITMDDGAADDSSSQNTAGQSSQPSNTKFDFDNNCFVCGEDASETYVKKDLKHPRQRRNPVSVVTNERTVATIRKAISSDNVIWHRAIVKQRLEGLSDEDLQTMGLKYHSNCFRRFRTNNSGRRSGRPLVYAARTALTDWHDVVDREHSAQDIKQDDKDTTEQWLNDSEDKRAGIKDGGRATEDQCDDLQDFDTDNDLQDYGWSDVTIKKEETSDFDYKNLCLICGKSAIGKYPRLLRVQADTSAALHSFDCGREFQYRIKDKDLVALKARYHAECYDNYSKASPVRMRPRFSKQQKKDQNKAQPKSMETKSKNKKSVRKADDSEAIANEEVKISEFIEEPPREVCSTCLSFGRKLHRLVHFGRLYSEITGNIDTKNISVCWECIGVLRKVQEFKAKAEKAQNILSIVGQQKESKPLITLSTLTSVQLYEFDISTHEKDVITHMDVKKYEEKRVIVTENQVFIPDATDIQYNDENHDNVFENDRFSDDVNMDDDNFDVDFEEYVKKNDSNDYNEGNNKKISEKIKMEDDDDVEWAEHYGDDDSLDSDDEKLSKKVKRSKSDDSAEDSSESEDEAPPPKKSKDTEDITQDDDYVPSWSSSNNKETKRRTYTKRERRYKRHACRSEMDETKIVKKVRIEPEEAEVWMNRERNSAFFVKLERKCVLCVTQLVATEALNDHIERVHKKTASDSVCPICKIVFRNASTLDAHLEHHNFVFRCTLCGYLCYTKRHMTQHLGVHRSYIECLDCGAFFRYTKEFQEHHNENHRVFTCDDCGKKFGTKERLQKHVFANHTTHQCDECAKTFNEYRKLSEHKKLRHTIDRTEESFCVSCGIQFDNKMLLKRHIDTHIAHAHERNKPPKPKERCPCPECGRVLSSKFSLEFHYKTFHTDERIPCPICGKGYARKGRLTEHIKRVHEQVQLPRDKICQYCGRGFTLNKILNNHMRTHTGEKPHKCQFCDAAFAQHAALWSHLKRH